MDKITVLYNKKAYVLKTYYGSTPGSPTWFGSGNTSWFNYGTQYDPANDRYTDAVSLIGFPNVPDLSGKTVKKKYLEFTTSGPVSGTGEICILPSDYVHDPTNPYSDTKSSTLYSMVQGLTALASFALPDNGVYGSIEKLKVDIPDTDSFLLCATRGIAFRGTTSDRASIYNPTLVVEYANKNLPAIITSVTPNKKTIIGNDDNVFEWTYAQEAGELQTHYDLQYSTNSGVTWTTYADKVESATPSCTIPGGTLASGNYLWRVRVYTLSGTVVSSWAQGQVTVQNNASTSGVDCDGAPMPTITWTAVEQAAYQVKFGDYDSGTVYSADGAHTIPRYFADGVYGIQVRTQTSSGVWSEWTTPLYVEIVNEPGATIELTAFAHEYGVGLTWDGEYDNYYVLRDGVPIATVEDNAYYDALAYREHTYAVLAPMSGGYYTKSNEVSQSPALRHDIIADINALEWIPLKYALGSRVMRNYTDSTTVTYREFAGREYPVGFVSEHKAGGLSARYAFKTAAEADAVRALVGKTIVYKDRRGGRIVGILDSASRAVGKLYDMTLTITQTDYPEAVDYEIDNAPS